MLRKYALQAVALFIGLVLAFIVAEIVARSMGITPWKYRETPWPLMFDNDAVLGWKNKPGEYLVPPFTPEGRETTVTNLPDGSRATSSVIDDPIPTARKAIFGCSFTNGWGLSDGETYSWKLQARYPGSRVANFGTGGYGTYQSLLLLERYFAEAKEAPELVIYGFIQNHEMRNVASYPWLFANAFDRQQRMVPFVSMSDEGTIIRQPPDSYPIWPFAEESAFITLLQGGYAQFKTAGHSNNERPIAVELIRQMARLSAEHNSRFITVLLDAPPAVSRHYTTVLGKSGIEVADCVLSERLTNLMIPGAHHPNGDANSLWAECIASAIDEPR